MFNSSAVKEQLTNALHWAASGSKLTYAALCVGLLVALILCRIFFKNLSGLFHAIGFSIGSGGSPAVAAQPGLSSSSRLKLLLAVLLPIGSVYAAITFLPKWFPSVFK